MYCDVGLYLHLETLALMTRHVTDRATDWKRHKIHNRTEYSAVIEWI